MKITRLTLCSLALVLAGLGCHSQPEKSDFLTGNEPMHPGKFLQEWWTAGPIDKQTVARIYIEPIDVTRIQDTAEISALYASNFLAQTAAYDIKANSGFTVVTDPADATARLTLAIVYMTPGSTSGRLWAGEIGVGDSIVQLDGKVTDASGKEIACFAHRRADSAEGGAEDLGGNAGQRLVRRSLDYTCIKFVNELTNSLAQ